MQPTECCQFVQIYRASQAARRPVCLSVCSACQPVCPASLSLCLSRDVTQKLRCWQSLQELTGQKCLLVLLLGHNWLLQTLMPLRINGEREREGVGGNATRGFVWHVHVHGISMRFAAAIRDSHDASSENSTCEHSCVNVCKSVYVFRWCISMSRI